MYNYIEFTELLNIYLELLFNTKLNPIYILPLSLSLPVSPPKQFIATPAPVARPSTIPVTSTPLADISGQAATASATATASEAACIASTIASAHASQTSTIGSSNLPSQLSAISPSVSVIMPRSPHKALTEASPIKSVSSALISTPLSSASSIPSIHVRETSAGEGMELVGEEEGAARPTSVSVATATALSKVSTVDTTIKPSSPLHTAATATTVPVSPLPTQIPIGRRLARTPIISSNLAFASRPPLSTSPSMSGVVLHDDKEKDHSDIPPASAAVVPMQLYGLDREEGAGIGTTEIAPMAELPGSPSPSPPSKTPEPTPSRTYSLRSRGTAQRSHAPEPVLATPATETRRRKRKLL